jgi:hypothetical protein
MIVSLLNICLFDCALHQRARMCSYTRVSTCARLCEYFLMTTQLRNTVLLRQLFLLVVYVLLLFTASSIV